ncbi:hypothetical protein AB1P65_09525 [Roseibium alexandrii]
MTKATRLTKIEFAPGIIKDDSATASEGAWIDGDNVRFRYGRAQTEGGYEVAATSFTDDPCRGAHAWGTLLGDRVVLGGDAEDLKLWFGGAVSDVTPKKGRGTLTDPFTTVSGSDVVTVDNGSVPHGLKPDDTVVFDLADAVGGITIDGTYTVTEVKTNFLYTITHTSNASSSATGGGNVEWYADLEAGLVNGIGGAGYGTGTYGTGLYGFPTSGDVEPRTWDIDNWGQNGIAIPRDGAFYEFQPARSYLELISNGDFASSDDWTTGAGWSIGSGVATATAGSASDLEQDVTGILSGGLVYVLTVDVTVSAGTCQFEVTDSTPSDTALGVAFDKSGSYTRYFRCPASPTKIKFAKDASFAGTIDNVSIKVASVAYRISSAPQYNQGGFVDPQRIAVVYGTVEADGDYNQMLVRWSDQEDLATWIPSDDNLAGEFVLGSGSAIIGHAKADRQNLIFTDTSVYSMQYTGSSSTVFRFDEISDGGGLKGKHAACSYMGRVFYWGRDDVFRVYQGGQLQIIANRVRRDVRDNLSPNQQNKIFAVAYPEFDEIRWYYPDSRDGNEVSRYVSYNFTENHWSVGHEARSYGIKAGVYEDPLLFGTDGNLYFHERGNSANGDALSRELVSAWFDIEDGDNLLYMDRIEPDIEDQVGALTISIRVKNRPHDPDPAWTDYTINPAASSSRTLKIDCQHTGRRMQVKLSSNAAGSFWRIGAMKVQIKKTGMQR